MRLFLYVSAGVFGAAIMVVEILGAKILAPYIGTSHFVWTAQIGVTLAALACGYALGGRFANSRSALNGLYLAVFGAALWLTLTVLFLKPLVYAFLLWPLALGSLVSSTLLYFVPLGLLAMGGPFLLRQITPSVGEVGKVAGRLSALNTLGSFVGTATIGYFLIPLVPSSLLMIGTAAALGLLSITYFAVWWRKKGPGRGLLVGTALSVLVAACLWAGAPAPVRDHAALELLETRESAFGELQVARLRNTSYVYFINDNLVQNTYDQAAGKSVSVFTYLLEGLATAYVPRLETALCIGMGVGIVPRNLAARGVKTDVVEINPQLEVLAQRYFELDTSRFTLVIEDGRRFLETATGPYDAIILDAFVGDSSPAHLQTREAFASVKRLLSPEGVLVINTFADLADPEDFYAASLYRTLLSEFPSVRVHGLSGGNAFFVASVRPDLAFARPPDTSGVHQTVRTEAKAAYTSLWTPRQDAGTVLTDDFNPLEFRDAPKREALRRTLALSLQDL